MTDAVWPRTEAEKRHLALHNRLYSRRAVLPTDYREHGGNVERDLDGDCSCGCVHAAWLRVPLGSDWCVCTKLGGPREGLLTFEHQAGAGCFESKRSRHA